MLHSHLQGHILLKTHRSLKWLSSRESRCITLLWQQAGKQIYSCEVNSANKPTISQWPHYHWHLGYLALQSENPKGIFHLYKSQIIKTLSEDDPDRCTEIPSRHIGCLSKNAVCVLFRTKVILSEKGSEQAEHRGTNRNFTMHHLTKREGYMIATYEPFWLVILGICQIECKVNEDTKQLTET